MVENLAEGMEERKQGRIKATFPKLCTSINQFLNEIVICLSVAFWGEGKKRRKQDEKGVSDSI